MRVWIRRECVTPWSEHLEVGKSVYSTVFGHGFISALVRSKDNGVEQPTVTGIVVTDDEGHEHMHNEYGMALDACGEVILTAQAPLSFEYSVVDDTEANKALTKTIKLNGFKLARQLGQGTQLKITTTITHKWFLRFWVLFACHLVYRGLSMLGFKVNIQPETSK